jgi:hypothetical protein
VQSVKPGQIRHFSESFEAAQKVQIWVPFSRDDTAELDSVWSVTSAEDIVCRENLPLEDMTKDQVWGFDGNERVSLKFDSDAEERAKLTRLRRLRGDVRRR